MRDMPASVAAAMNESKWRTSCPIAIDVLLSNGTAPRSDVIAVAAAADSVEWPDKYSGKGGVGIVGSHVESMNARMYVRGRMRFSLNLYPHDEMNASARAADVAIIT